MYAFYLSQSIHAVSWYVVYLMVEQIINVIMSWLILAVNRKSSYILYGNKKRREENYNNKQWTRINGSLSSLVLTYLSSVANSLFIYFLFWMLCCKCIYRRGIYLENWTYIKRYKIDCYFHTFLYSPYHFVCFLDMFTYIFN